ncbi:hypothetical protein ABGB17_38690 [Sphaerisporangium sp. B11E5]|uniref:hypothetical protein n=1 Tax=Sphaerisporangium sp. B11E5 TaxID=3153563 RepID=UPI00325F3BCE
MEPLIPPSAPPFGHEPAGAGPWATPDVARPRFWAERPAAFYPAMPERSADGGHRGPDLVPPGGGALVYGVRLARGVTLMLDGRTPGLDDVAAIRSAAGPLLAVLQERHLVAGQEPAEPADAGPDAADTIAGNPEGMQR